MLSLRPVDGQDGVFFEDLKVGQEFTSPGRTVTEADIVIFAALSGDYNVLHTDAEHMKASIFGERIAHGLLGLSIQQGLASRGEPAAAHGLLSALTWKFKGPSGSGTPSTSARASWDSRGVPNRDNSSLPSSARS